MSKSYCVYILASRKYGALYVGVTSDLVGRVHIHNLVYFEVHDDPEGAILREKQIKKWRRAWKIELIEKGNPDWRDLYEEMAS